MNYNAIKSNAINYRGIFSALTASLALLLSAAPAIADQARADNLKFSVGQQGPAMILPSKGDSKNTVQEQFGPPAGTFQAVGTPPITRWVFDDFTVYFEYNHVVHAVTHHHASPGNR